MLELLRNAGAAGYVVLLMGGLGGALALLALALFVSPRTLRVSVILAGVVAGLGATTLLVGAAGRISGRMATFRAVAYAAPDQRATLLQVGFAEATASTTLGAVFGAPLLLLGLGLVGGAFARTGDRS